MLSAPKWLVGPEARRVVEGGDRQVHVRAFLELEAERGAAFAAIRPPGDRRAVVPVRPAVPANVGLLEILEGDGDRAGGPLAHAAVAEIGLVIIDSAVKRTRPQAHPPVMVDDSVMEILRSWRAF